MKRKIVRRALIVLLVLVLLLVAAPVLFVALGIPVNLAWLREPVARLASDALAMDVSIRGDTTLIPGLSPTLEMRGLRIADSPSTPEPRSVEVGLARAQVSVLPLLRGTLRIKEITAEDVHVAFAMGRSSYDAGGGSTEPAPETAPAAPSARGRREAPALVFEELAELGLRRVLVEARDSGTGRDHRFELDEMVGAATFDEPMQLEARGAYQKQPFHLKMTGGTMADVLTKGWSWPLDLSAEFAGVKLRLAPARDRGDAPDEALLDYTLDVQGDRLDSLDEAAGVSLPPLGPYKLGGRFSVRENRYAISDFLVQVGESYLGGTFHLDRTGPLPHVEINLATTQLRLDDFDTGDWSAVRGDKRPSSHEPTTRATTTAGEAGQVAALISPEVLRRLTAHFSLTIDSVRSGDRVLGGGLIEISLEDGRLAVDPFRIELPAGPVDVKVVVDSATSEELAGSHLLPESISARVAGTSLHLARISDEADADRQGSEWDVRYRMHIAGKNLAHFDKFAGVALPPLGPYELDTVINVLADRYSLTGLGIRVADSDLEGSMELDLGGSRPRAQVQLQSANLQVRNFVFDDWSAVDSPAATSEGQRDAETSSLADDVKRVNAMLSPEVLGSIDALFSLEIAQVVDGEQRLGGGLIRLELADGRLTVDPFRINLVPGPVDLTMVVDSTAGTGFEGSHLLPVTITGEVAGTTLRLARASGETAEAASPESSGVLYHLRVAGERLDRFNEYAGVSLPPIGPYELTTSIHVRERHYSLTGMNIHVADSGLKGDMRLDTSGARPRAEINLASSHLQLENFVFDDWSPVKAATNESRDERIIDTTAISENVKQVDSMLSPKVLGSIDGLFKLEIAQVLDGRRRLGGGLIKLELVDGRLTLKPFRINLVPGPVDITLVMDSKSGAGFPGSHLLPESITGALAGTTLELAKISPQATGGRSDAPHQVRYQLMIRGERLDRFNSYAGVALPPLGPYRMRAKVNVRDRYLSLTGMDIRVADSDLKGEMRLDLRAAKPRAEVRLESANLQLENFVFDDWSPLESADTAGAHGPTIDATAISENVKQVDAMLSPAVLGNIDALFALEIAQVLEGHRRLGGGLIKLELADGRLTLDPLRINLVPGPVDVTMVVDSTSGTGFAGSHLLPVSVTGKVAGTTLELMRAATDKPGDAPEGKWDIRYHLLVKGESLDRFDKFAGALLPPLGPYELSTDIGVRRHHYSLTDLNVRVGESDLTGSMTLATDGVRPRAEVRLATDRLQLENFIFENWSAAAAGFDEEDSASGVDREEVLAVLTPEVMGRLDALLSVQVQEVLLGAERFGGGRLGAALEDGRLAIEPMHVDIPGGSVDMRIVLEPTREDLAAEIGLDIERFDYGVLARRVKPETDMAGHLSLDVALTTRAESPETLLNHANGHLTFGIWPDDFEADIFDLWAVNLLTAILPRVDEGPKSTVNCVVARLTLEDGLLTEKVVHADTTNMEVGATVKADFKTRRIDVYAKPRAKKAQFFSLATPIQVQGTFTDFHLTPAPGAVIGSAVRFLTSIVTTPVRRIIETEIPADGEPACTIAFRGEVPADR